jgi:hypothetical protein
MSNKRHSAACTEALDETQEIDMDSIKEAAVQKISWKKVSLKNLIILTTVFFFVMLIGLIIGQVMLG